MRNKTAGKFLIVLVCMVLIFHQTLPARGAVTSPIQHVIIIMQENHSFDNYFGTYPTANETLTDPTIMGLDRVNGIPSHACLPGPNGCIFPTLAINQSPQNPVEGQLTYEMDYSRNGTGFPAYSGPQSMVYYDYHTIPAYWDYAENYGLADNYFAPVLSTTTPNRLMLLAGDTPVSENYGPPPYVSYSGTLMKQLDESSVSWGYYDHLGAFSGPLNAYPLNYTSDEPQSAIDKTKNIETLNQELAAGNGLPSVSFVNSLGRPDLTEHPPYSPTAGEIWTMSLVNKAMNSLYWPSTVVFITWDEGGGYYDHVIPPNEFTLNHSFGHPLAGLGQRVPLLVISPYSRQGYVSHDLLNHLSLLHFVEHNWDLPPLNALVNQSGLPLGFFDFSQAPRAPLLLSPSTSYPLPLQAPAEGIAPAFGIQYGILAAAVVLVVLVTYRRSGPRSLNRN